MLELIIALVFVGLLAGLAVPSFAGSFQRMRIQQVYFQIESLYRESYSYARSFRETARFEIRTDSASVHYCTLDAVPNCLLHKELTFPAGMTMENINQAEITFQPPNAEVTLRIDGTETEAVHNLEFQLQDRLGKVRLYPKSGLVETDNPVRP